jgi:hypothetical protein
MFGVVESMRKLSCAECCYLNKVEKEENILNRYRYRCMFSRRDYIVGSIQKDSELKIMGCSDCNRIEIGTLFKLKSETNTYTILYCGKVGNKYLLYNQNLKTFRLVKSTWLSEHIKRIQFCECNDTKMNTREDRIEFRKKIAKAKKERYIREHGCNRN